MSLVYGDQTIVVFCNSQHVMSFWVNFAKTGNPGSRYKWHNQLLFFLTIYLYIIYVDSFMYFPSDWFLVQVAH